MVEMSVAPPPPSLFFSQPFFFIIIIIIAVIASVWVYDWKVAAFFLVCAGGGVGGC